jgi:ABC-2 type transport system ATP-binding protein
LASWALIEGIRRQGVTILLVSHFMEEAERLCDRVAVIEAGRVAAIGSPAAGKPPRRRAADPFHPSGRWLTAQPTGSGQSARVMGVSRTGDTVVVTGTADALAVTSALARRGVVAQGWGTRSRGRVRRRDRRAHTHGDVRRTDVR